MRRTIDPRLPRRFIRVPSDPAAESIPPPLPIPLVAKKADPEPVFALTRRRSVAPAV